MWRRPDPVKHHDQAGLAHEIRFPMAKPGAKPFRRLRAVFASRYNVVSGFSRTSRRVRLKADTTYMWERL